MSVEKFISDLQIRRSDIIRELEGDPKPDRWRKAKLNRDLNFINEKLKLATRERIQ